MGMIPSEQSQDLLQSHAGNFTPPPIAQEKKNPPRRLSSFRHLSFKRNRSLSQQDSVVSEELLRTCLFQCSLEEIRDSIPQFMKVEFFTPTTLPWLIKWATEDPRSTIGIKSTATLGFLAFPKQKIPGIYDLIFETPGLVKNLIRVAVENHLLFCKDIEVDKISKGDKLGGGCGGCVYEADYKDKKVAVKEFKVLGTWISFDKEFYYEAAVICLFGSFKHFIHCFGINFNHAFIVMPLAINKSLDHFIQDGKLKDCDWNRRLTIALQISTAMKTLHQYGIIHRDLKPANILLDKDLNCYLSDFGVSASVEHLTKNRNRSMTMNVGTSLFMAPEVSEGNGFYHAAIDVYSFSVILWQLVTECPYPYIDQGIPIGKIPEYISSGKRLEIPNDCNPEIESLISKCWSSNPKKRPTFKQITDIIQDMLKNMEL